MTSPGTEDVKPHRGATVALRKIFTTSDLFQGRIEAIRELALDAHVGAQALDDRAAIFRRSVRVWNTVDSDEVVDNIFRLSVTEIARELEEIESSAEKGARAASMDALAEPIVAKYSFELSKFKDYDWRFFKAWNRALNRGSRSEEMLASLLVSAVSAVEVLISDVFRIYSIAYPQVLKELDSKKFSYLEVVAHGSVEEFKAHCAEQWVAEKMYGSLSSWFDWLGRHVKIALSEVTSSPDEVIEAFLRRNLIVHNSSRVNSIYLDRLPEGLHRPNLGARIVVDKKYLGNVLDRVQAMGHMVVFGLTRSISALLPESLDVADVIVGEATFDLLSEGHHRSVVDLADKILAFGPKDEAKELVQVNRWIALKYMGGVDAIRADVEDWDTSGIPKRFELARLALLERHDEAIPLAEELLKDGELLLGDLVSWPLFEQLREHVRSTRAHGTFAQTLSGLEVDGDGEMGR